MPEGEAVFSRCGRYRWWLRRRWRADAPALLFLGLNPSRADAGRDDPTLRRLVGFAEAWGYGAVEVLNLFAWISSDPAGLRLATDPVGPRNEDWIRRRVQQLARQEQRLGPPAFSAKALSATDLPRLDARDAPSTAALPLWLGWGNGGGWRGRDRQVLRLLEHLPVRLVCLGCTAAGQPRHPLYAPAGSPLQPFGASWEQASAAIAAPCPAPRAATRST